MVAVAAVAAKVAAVAALAAAVAAAALAALRGEGWGPRSAPNAQRRALLAIAGWAGSRLEEGAGDRSERADATTIHAAVGR